MANTVDTDAGQQPLTVDTIPLEELPAPIYTGLDLYDWDSVTLSATPVNSWTDSGQGIEVTQTGTARPAWYDVGGPQALQFPVVHADGIDDFMASAGSLGLDWSGGVSMFLVKERITISGFAGPYLIRADGKTRQQENFGAEAANLQTAMNFSCNRDASFGYYGMRDVSLNTTDPVLWSLRMIDPLGTGSSPDPARQNEVDVTTLEGGGPEEGPQSSVDIIELLHGYNGSKWNAYLYRLMFYVGRDMTESEEQGVVDYLRNKYFGGAY